MANDGTVKIGTGLDQSGLKKGLSQVGGLAKQGFSAMGNAAAAMAKTATAAIGGMVTAVSGAGAAAYKFGTEYETSAAKVSTIADTSKISMEALGESVLKLSNDTGEAATGLNEALYSAISAGADTAHAVDLVEVAVKAARGGFTDTETAVDGLTSALNAYGMETTDAEGLANKFLVTQNLGKTTFGELAGSIGGVAPTAHAAGVSIDELLSGVASLTANGVGTSEAMTGIKAALSNVIKPSSEAAEMAAQLGLDFSTAALQSKGLAGFLDDVKKATGGNTDKMAKLFGSVEALNTVLTLTSDQGSALMNKTLEEMATNTTALDDAYEKMSNTAEVHVQKIGNSFKNLGISIYQDTKGPIADFTGLLSDAAEDISAAYAENGFSGLAEQLGTSLSGIITEVAGMAPKLIDAGVKLLNNFLSGIVKNKKKLGKAGADIIGSLGKGIISSAGSLMSAGLEIITSIVGGLNKQLPGIAEAARAAASGFMASLRECLPQLLQSGVELIQNIGMGIAQELPNIITQGAELLQWMVQGITEAIPQLLPVVQEIITNLIIGITANLPSLISSGITILESLASGIAQMLPTLIPLAINAVLTLVQSLTDPGNISSLIDAGIQLLTSLVEGIVNAIPSLLEQAPVIIGNLCTALAKNLPKIVEAGLKILTSIINGIVKNLPKLVSAAGDIISSIWDTIKNIDWLQLGSDILHGILNGLSSLGSAVWDAITEVGNSILDGFKDFFGIHSPSRLMRDMIGKNVIAGIGVGFEMESDNLDAQAEDVMKKATSAMQKVNADSVVKDMQIEARNKGRAASYIEGVSGSLIDYERLGYAVKKAVGALSGAGNTPEYIVLNIDGEEFIRWCKDDNENYKKRSGGFSRWK